MRTETIEIFTYDELSDKAKASAREWFCSADASETFWSDGVIEDATLVGKYLGFEIDFIPWSGFWSQGDGACIIGTWRASWVTADKLKEHAPEDKELHRLADTLARMAARSPDVQCAIVRNSHHYNHEHSVRFDFDDIDAEEDEKVIEDASRDFMRWIYRQLEESHHAYFSDENIGEILRINEYEFTANGDNW